VRTILESNDEFVLRHGFTYSGHPTACAAGLANLDIMERDRLLDRVPIIAERLGGGLQQLASSRAVAEVRGIGGMWAIELGPDRTEAEVVGAILDRGVITRALPGTVTFCPPLVISDDELDVVVGVVGEVLG
jgi:adenosylmethionine-8-amino-7-oxononanoate aminotransferase